MLRHKSNIGRSQSNTKRMRIVRRVRREQQSNNDVVNDRGSWSSNDYSTIHYDLIVDYKNDPSVIIGNPTIVCHFCSALRWKDECKSLCCSNGKVKLDDIIIPPEPLNSFNGSHTKHKQFIRDIRYYNNTFQMTSFRSQQVVHKGFMPTFKVQGQVYHVAGSIFPYRPDDHTFCRFILFPILIHKYLHDVT